MKVSFVDIGKPRMGSSRIYGYFLSELLERVGLRVTLNKDLKGDEDVVIVGKGSDRLPRYLAKAPRAIFGLINPSLDRVRRFPTADFFVVGSQEEADSLAFTRKPRLYFPQIEPNIISPPKTHIETEAPTLVYHGNKEHLEQISRNARQGIIAARSEQEFTIRLIYDWKRLGKADLGLGKSIPVEHIQWKQNSFQKEIQGGDIGLAFANSPTSMQAALKAALTPEEHAEHHVYSVKRLNNVGRPLLMSQLGIPVITEISPAALSLYGHPSRGLVCKSEESWTEAILHLAKSALARDEMAREALEFVALYFDPTEHARKFADVLNQLVKPR